MLDISLFQVVKRYGDDTTLGAFDATDGEKSFHIKPFKGNESSVVMEFIGAKVFKAISDQVGTFVPAEGVLATHNGDLVFASRMFSNFHSIHAENKKIKSSVARRKRNENLESAYPFFFICYEDDRSVCNVGMDNPISMIDFARFCSFYGLDIRKLVKKFFTLWKDSNMYDPTKYTAMNLNKVQESLQRIDGNLQGIIFNAIDAAIESLKQTEAIDIASINFVFKNIDTDKSETKAFETFEALANHIKTQISYNISHVLPALMVEVQNQIGVENHSFANLYLSTPTASTPVHSTSALSVVLPNSQSSAIEGLNKRRRCIAANLFVDSNLAQTNL